MPRTNVLFTASFLGTIFVSVVPIILGPTPEENSLKLYVEQVLGVLISALFLGLGVAMLFSPKLVPIDNEQPGERKMMGWGFLSGGIIGMLLVINW